MDGETALRVLDRVAPGLGAVVKVYSKMHGIVLKSSDDVLYVIESAFGPFARRVFEGIFRRYERNICVGDDKY